MGPTKGSEGSEHINQKSNAQISNEISQQKVTQCRGDHKVEKRQGPTSCLRQSTHFIIKVKCELKEKTKQKNRDNTYKQKFILKTKKWFPFSCLVTKQTYNCCPIGLTSFFSHNFMPGKPLLITDKILRKKIINIIFLSLLKNKSTTFSLLLRNKKFNDIYLNCEKRKSATCN